MVIANNAKKMKMKILKWPTSQRRLKFQKKKPNRECGSSNRPMCTPYYLVTWERSVMKTNTYISIWCYNFVQERASQKSFQVRRSYYKQDAPNQATRKFPTSRGSNRIHAACAPPNRLQLQLRFSWHSNQGCSNSLAEKSWCIQRPLHPFHFLLHLCTDKDVWF